MSRFLVALLVVALAGCGKDEQVVPRPALNEAQETVAVHADIREGYRALYGNDLDAVLARTHPVVIEGLGGQAKARDVIAKAVTKFQSVGMKVKRLELKPPPTFMVGRDHHFVIVPTRVLITANGQQVESHNFQFGVRSVGETRWRYFEGSRITLEFIRSRFPDLPSDAKFPVCSRRKL
jgi:hypothetical protein